MVLTSWGFSFQESTDLDDEEDEEDKVSVLREKKHGKRELIFSANMFSQVMSNSFFLKSHGVTGIVIF